MLYLPFLINYSLLNKKIWVFVFYLFVLAISIKQINSLEKERLLLHFEAQINSHASSLRPPINVYTLDTPAVIQTAKINFEFTSNDPTFSYGNLFQTTSSPDGIRLEF